MSDRLLKESDVLRAVDKRIEELSKDPVFIRKNRQIDLYGIKKYLLAIPTAEWPRGEWIVSDKDSVCSVCGKDEAEFICGTEDWYGYGLSKYCPNCGARMKGTRMKGADDGE